jgi:sulfur-carrier protein
VRLVYFASVRECVGIDGEDIVLPESVLSVSDCLDWLVRRGVQYETAFANKARLRFALDQTMVSPDALLSGSVELAIFPPVTGG